MGDREQPDVGAALTIARDNLLRLADTLTELHRDLYAGDWTPESGRGSTDPYHSPWLQAGPVQAGYIGCCNELSRAHWCLRDLDVADHWLRRPSDRTVPLWEAVTAVVWLWERLGDLQAVRDDLRPPEESLVVECCDHVSAAVEHVPEGFGQKVARQPRRDMLCRNPDNRLQCQQVPVYDKKRRLCQSCYNADSYQRRKTSAA